MLISVLATALERLGRLRRPIFVRARRPLRHGRLRGRDAADPLGVNPVCASVLGIAAGARWAASSARSPSATACGAPISRLSRLPSRRCCASSRASAEITGAGSGDAPAPSGPASFQFRIATRPTGSSWCCAWRRSRAAALKQLPLRRVTRRGARERGSGEGHRHRRVSGQAGAMVISAAITAAGAASMCSISSLSMRHRLRAVDLRRGAARPDHRRRRHDLWALARDDRAPSHRRGRQARRPGRAGPRSRRLWRRSPPRRLRFPPDGLMGLSRSPRLGRPGHRRQPAAGQADAVRASGHEALRRPARGRTTPRSRSPAGTIVALIGPNGAGKTTLFAIIAGFLEPNAGPCVLRGDDIDGRAAAPDLARHGITRTFQIVQPFAASPCARTSRSGPTCHHASAADALARAGDDRSPRSAWNGCWTSRRKT